MEFPGDQLVNYTICSNKEGLSGHSISVPDPGPDNHKTDGVLESEDKFTSSEPGSENGAVCAANLGIDNVAMENVDMEKKTKSDVCKFAVNTENNSSNKETNANSLQKQKSLRKYSWNVDCLLIFVTGVSILLLAYTIAKIVIGSIYFNECELEPLLPIFLIVDACVAFLFFAMPYFYTRDHNQEKPKYGQWKCPAIVKAGCVITLVLLVFHTLWLIYGTVIVVETRNTIYSDNHCKNSTTSQLIQDCVTCNETLADFTLVIVVVQWVIVALITIIALLFSCCFLWSACIKK